MIALRRVVRLSTACIVSAFLSACGGSHGSGSATIPGLPSSTLGGTVLRAPAAATADVVAINSGGGSAGSFAADTDVATAGTWTSAATAAVDTSGVTNAASQAVYQTQRVGTKIVYTIPGLTAGAGYVVRLSFAELYWTAAGKRSFNVVINGAGVLANFDVFATSGARYKAVTQSFAATAGSSGTIVVTLTAVTNYAVVNALEIVPPGNATPAPTPAPGGGVAIDAGGNATGSFSADADFVAPGTWKSVTTAAIDLSGVTSPAPQAVYASQRVGSKITYTIPGLTAGAAYTVRLDFAELYWTAAAKRSFNISLNNVAVSNNFDIFATAAARNKAVAAVFSTTASSTGTITITLTAVTDYAVINGIEIAPGGGSPPPPPPPAGFNDYSTFGYDNRRDVFNPNSTAIAPANLAKLHLAWQARVGGGDFNTQTQPVLATEIPGHAGVLFVGGGSGHVDAHDALTGKLLWSTSIGQMRETKCGGGTSYFGAGGTVAYDPATKSLYVAGNQNASPDAFGAAILYHLDAATGSILGQVNFTPSAAGASEQNITHTAVTLNNGIAYVGTGSTCDLASWRGRVVAVNVPSMTLAATFFTVWDPQNVRGAGAQSWSGAGIWGWGGVSLDFNGNVLTGVGNADDSSNGKIVAPFTPAPKEYSGYAETLLELSPAITTVIAANHPIPTNSYAGMSVDIDVQGTPLVFAPNGTGCGTMIALQGKSGELTLYNENSINTGLAAQYQLAPSTYEGGYLGDPAYSPATGLVYAPVASSVSPTLFAPGLIAVNPGCGHPSVTWHAAFGTDSTATGIPRSVPAASAGGVVFAGSVNAAQGEIWAIDASTGAVLNAGKPLLQTSGHVRMPATIDGNWVFIVDNNGNMYGLTIDPSFPAIAAKARAADSRLREQWGRPRN